MSVVLWVIISILRGSIGYSSLSLILPGNDDDSHLQTSTSQTAEAALAAMCSRSGPWMDFYTQAAAEMALRIHLTLQCWIVLMWF